MSNWKENFYGISNAPFRTSELSYWFLSPENTKTVMGWLLGRASFSSVATLLLKDDPSESAVSIKMYPFDFDKLTSKLSEEVYNQPMFLTSDEQTFKIAGIELDGGIINEVIKPDVIGIKISGCVAPFYKVNEYTFNRHFNSFLDYSPYTRIKVMLPFIGEVELNADDVMGKTVGFYYAVDITSGNVISIIVNETTDHVIGSYTSMVGVDIPKVAKDYSEIARKVIGAALTAGIALAGAGVGAIGSSAISSGASTLDWGVLADIPSLMTSGEAKIQQGLRLQNIGSSMAKQAPRPSLNSMYAPSIMRNKITCGGGLSSWFTPRNIIITIERPFVKYPSSYNHEYGRPLMETATLKELEGFTIVDSVHMDGFTCTDEELSMIERLLFNGVILGEKLPTGLFDIYVNSINATYSNNSAQAESGSSYVNTFTPNEGYTFKGVEPRVVMADESVIGAYTYDADSDTITINIPEVRGNIIIGVAAVDKEARRFTITNTLTNIVTNANFDEINEGIPYDAVLSGKGNYSMYEADVQVMMDGVDITSTAYTPASSPTENGTIHIDSVSGNIEVYAQAEKQKTYNVSINLENALNISGFDSDTVELYAPIDAWYTGASGYKLVTVPIIRIGGTLKNQYYTLDRSTGQIHIEIPADVIDGDVEISITATKEYSITRNFTNVAIASGSAVDKIVAGEEYSVNIKGIVGGYVITTYTVMMGGVDATFKYSVWDESTEIVSINIPSVTGDIVITANAEKPASSIKKYSITYVNCLLFDSEQKLLGRSENNQVATYTYESTIGERVEFVFEPAYVNSSFSSYRSNSDTAEFKLQGDYLFFNDTTSDSDVKIIVSAVKPTMYTVTFKLANIDIHDGSYDGNVFASSNSSNGSNFRTFTMEYAEGSHGYWYFTKYGGDSTHIVSTADQYIYFTVYDENGEVFVDAVWNGGDLLNGDEKARWDSYINQNFTIEVQAMI